MQNHNPYTALAQAHALASVAAAQGDDEDERDELYARAYERSLADRGLTAWQAGRAHAVLQACERGRARDLARAHLDYLNAERSRAPDLAEQRALDEIAATPRWHIAADKFLGIVVQAWRPAAGFRSDEIYGLHADTRAGGVFTWLSHAGNAKCARLSSESVKVRDAFITRALAADTNAAPELRAQLRALAALDAHLLGDIA
ncbi:hypothetical protein [Paraburkholderia mimosarum]|uniref:hypothetical protein n=1 Tax=Paraburkholderia mimosarum TaxID=312026 RepID=UPI00040190A0|nr:hypothetical protein [Paraburkholderia mimosarum]